MSVVNVKKNTTCIVSLIILVLNVIETILYTDITYLKVAPEYAKSGPKIIKLKLETNLKSQALDWLKWWPVAISANQMLETGLQSPFYDLGPIIWRKYQNSVHV
jgi:hypothetical protein